MEEKWNKFYSEGVGWRWYPDEGIVKFTARYLQQRVGIDTYDKKRKVKRILDAGCGNGVYVVFFAEQGFDTYGIDISEEAIEIATENIARKGLKAHLGVGDLKKLPFESRYFDVAVSYGVLDHVLFTEAKEIMSEIWRVMDNGGYIYITLRSTEDAECGRGEEVANNTYVLQEGYEKGIIQHFFDLAEIKGLLKDFNVFDIELHEESFPDIFTVDKAFTQSSKGVKRHLDLSNPVNLGLKYARWHIAAEKR
ncbi:MAG: class I SAM-dependent methyltransferase [Dehalococcoidales bacterium]|nr:class I SAM-dependent methyltransferase [Dehalococcoidales bacterium]